jgi:hypothetical protein
VDAGAADAVSFFTYCQSMKDHDVAGTAFAFDDWDPAAPASHPEATFDALVAHARRYYPGFAYVVRSAPDGVASRFEAGTVDLVRVDGTRASLVTPGALDGWFDRLRPGGVLALHGTKVEGTSDAWASLAARGDAIALGDARGLGLLRKPGGAPNGSDLVRLAFGDRAIAELEAFYGHAREHHQMRRIVQRANG